MQLTFRSLVCVAVCPCTTSPLCELLPEECAHSEACRRCLEKNILQSKRHSIAFKPKAATTAAVENSVLPKVEVDELPKIISKRSYQPESYAAISGRRPNDVITHKDMTALLKAAGYGPMAAAAVKRGYPLGTASSNRNMLSSVKYRIGGWPNYSGDVSRRAAVGPYTWQTASAAWAPYEHVEMPGWHDVVKRKAFSIDGMSYISVANCG